MDAGDDEDDLRNPREKTPFDIAMASAEQTKAKVNVCLGEPRGLIQSAEKGSEAQAVVARIG